MCLAFVVVVVAFVVVVFIFIYLLSFTGYYQSLPCSLCIQCYFRQNFCIESRHTCLLCELNHFFYYYHIVSSIIIQLLIDNVFSYDFTSYFNLQ